MINKKNTKLIDEFLHYLNKERNFSKHTIRNYNIDLKQFSEFLYTVNASFNFLNLDKTILQMYIHQCSKHNFSDKTLSRKVASMKSLFKFLMQNSLIENNITSLIVSPKISKKIPNYLSKKEVIHLMSLPDLSTFRGTMHKCILEVLYSTGLRISELVNIQLVDFDLQKNIIKVKGKGDKERLVIIGKSASNSIKNYLRLGKNSDNIYLYPSSNKLGLHISVSYVYKMIKKYLMDVTKNEKMSPHSLRHSFATHLLDNGADLMSVKELLGHEDLSSTQVYTHISVEKMKKIYKKSHPHGK